MIRCAAHIRALLQRLGAFVVHARRESYRLGERVRTVAARRLGLDDFSRR